MGWCPDVKDFFLFLRPRQGLWKYQKIWGDFHHEEPVRHYLLSQNKCFAQFSIMIKGNAEQRSHIRNFRIEKLPPRRYIAAHSEPFVPTCNSVSPFSTKHEIRCVCMYVCPVCDHRLYRLCLPWRAIIIMWHLQLGKKRGTILAHNTPPVPHTSSKPGCQTAIDLTACAATLPRDVLIIFFQQ